MWAISSVTKMDAMKLKPNKRPCWPSRRKTESERQPSWKSTSFYRLHTGERNSSMRREWPGNKGKNRPTQRQETCGLGLSHMGLSRFGPNFSLNK